MYGGGRVRRGKDSGCLMVECVYLYTCVCIVYTRACMCVCAPVYVYVCGHVCLMSVFNLYVYMHIFFAVYLS